MTTRTRMVSSREKRTLTKNQPKVLEQKYNLKILQIKMRHQILNLLIQMKVISL